jgi:hypothetical protein
MNRTEIKELIKEAFTDKVYGKYPYSHKSGNDDEPSEDYQEDWDRLSLEILEDRSRAAAIQFAKLLVKDLEVLVFVLDAVGKDQSLGTEIMKKLEISSTDTTPSA